jgi:hypothetical protein
VGVSVGIGEGLLLLQFTLFESGLWQGLSLSGSLSGSAMGEAVGALVGLSVVGVAIGIGEGLMLVGVNVGELVVGVNVGTLVVGVNVGEILVGVIVGGSDLQFTLFESGLLQGLSLSGSLSLAISPNSADDRSKLVFCSALGKPRNNFLEEAERKFNEYTARMNKKRVYIMFDR